MSNRDFYQETFSQVHSSQEISWGNMSKKRRRSRHKKMLLLAAAIAVLAALTTAAMAMDLFGLKALLLPKETVDMGFGVEETVDVISLSGYADTPESRALAEWETFLAGYDTDGALLQAVGNEPTGLDEKYNEYTVYTQEMADELDKIVEKYDLKLHTESFDLLDKEAVIAAVGGDFLGENQAYSACGYEDGTFAFDGDCSLDGYGLVDYQFRRVTRGTFDTVVLNIGDAADYQEWTYQTASGVPVTLALSEEKSLILVDLPDCFVVLNVLAGTQTDAADIFSSGPFYAENLEALADSFNFAPLSPVEMHIP